MDGNINEFEMVSEQGLCACNGGATLDILKDVHKAYEERMKLVDTIGGSKKLQMQVDVLRSWVSDLVAQNTLLATALEDMEAEITTKYLIERKRHNEVGGIIELSIVCELQAEGGALRRRLARKDSDLHGLVEVLRRLREFDYCTLDGIHFFEVTESDIFGSVEWRQKKLDQGDVIRNNLKPVSSKMKIIERNTEHGECNKVIELRSVNETLQKQNVDRQKVIEKLNKDVQQYEQTILYLRNELSLSKYHTPDVSRKDVEVMVGAECGDWEPVKDFMREETQDYQERIQKMEDNLKSSGDNVRALRKANVALTEEASTMRRVCLALEEQSRAVTERSQFKDDIIREMRRQLKQAKAKLKEVSDLNSFKCQKQLMSGDNECVGSRSLSYESVTIACSRSLPRRDRVLSQTVIDSDFSPLTDDCRSLRLDGSGDESLSNRLE